MLNPAQALHVIKETEFFLFTDWGQTQGKAASQDVEHWPPFAVANPKDRATIKDLRQAINIRLDKRLSGLVDAADRVYFRHTNRGVELIRNDAPPHWEHLQGAIVDPDTASHGENSDKLSMLAKGLARKAPEYIRLRGEVLICLLPGSSAGPLSTLPTGNVARIKPTADSKTLVTEVLTWLTVLNVRIDDDRMNAPKPLRDAVEEFLEKILI
jgi:hypothetical protein